MEIHELNTFSGTLGASDYFVTDNGEDASKVSASAMFDPINARINNIITSPAPSEQEIIDARMDAYEGVYDTLGDAIREQIRGIQDSMYHRRFNVLDFVKKVSRTAHGITYSWNNDGTCTITGTTDASTNQNNIFYKVNALPPFLYAGQPVQIRMESDAGENSVVVYDIYKCVDGALGSAWLRNVSANYQGDGIIQSNIPADVSGLLIRLNVQDANVAVNETVRLSIVPLSTMENAGLAGGYTDDANNLKRNGIYFVSSSGGETTIANVPAWAQWLEVQCIGDKPSLGVLQISYPWDSNSENRSVMWRTCKSGVWNDWKSLGSGEGGGDTYIENTYNITTSPHFTTDTNGWLQPVDTETESETGKTDMTGAIMSMLTDTGYCHLAKGIYYVSGSIDMPYGSTLEGCGEDTIIRLLSSVQSGYCVKPTRYSTIKGIRFSGGYSNGDVSTSDIGTRNGVVFIANKDGQEASLPSVEPCMISDCWFENFSGSGIYCHNSGGGTRESLIVSSCYMKFCKVGINIDYYSEYHKFTNVITYRCYYACINKGGNNVFTACTFHGTVGFYMDGSKNNGHGSCVGCTFNHIDNWNRPSTLGGGLAVDAYGVTAGYIFTGCQFWYGELRVRGSRGIAFSDCQIGGYPTVTVTGGYPAFFSNCIFHASPTLNVNSSTKFDNCYLDEDGSPITA